MCHPMIYYLLTRKKSRFRQKEQREALDVLLVDLKVVLEVESFTPVA